MCIHSFTCKCVGLTEFISCRLFLAQCPEVKLNLHMYNMKAKRKVATNICSVVWTAKNSTILIFVLFCHYNNEHFMRETPSRDLDVCQPDNGKLPRVELKLNSTVGAILGKRK